MGLPWKAVQCDEKRRHRRTMADEKEREEERSTRKADEGKGDLGEGWPSGSGRNIWKGVKHLRCCRE